LVKKDSKKIIKIIDKTINNGIITISTGTKRIWNYTRNILSSRFNCSYCIICITTFCNKGIKK